MDHGTEDEPPLVTLVPTSLVTLVTFSLFVAGLGRFTQVSAVSATPYLGSPPVSGRTSSVSSMVIIAD